MTKPALLIGAAISALALSGCSTMNTTSNQKGSDQTASASRPAAASTNAVSEANGAFARPSQLPFQAPDFNAIGDADFRPAIERGMAIQKSEWSAIASNPEPADFANTIVALERSGRMLSRVLAVFGALTGANTNDTLDAVDREISPRLAAHSDARYLDDALFARVKAVHDQRAAMAMTPEDAVLLERTYEQFVHAGALLSPEQKQELRELNTRMSTLETQFSQKLTAATREQALVVRDRAALAGLSEAEIEAAVGAASERGLSGQYVLVLQNTTQQPMLASLENRAARQALFEKSWNRAIGGGENDTRAIVLELAQLRARKAALFGLPDFASYQMYDRMADDPATAIRFMAGLAGPTAATQAREAAAINAMIRAQGGDFTVEPWDWDFYAEKVRKAKYDLNEDEVKPYFEVDRVLEDGVFFAANRLFGLTFAKRDDIPVYHPTVSVYTVFDKDGSELALFYFDPFQRDNKRGGAWMSNFVEQSHLYGEKPVIYNVLNVPPPPEGEPALISFDHVITMFHEFGHALHGMFADQRYPSLSGTAVARDFVEFPSQMNEKWAIEPAVLANYAKHYRTGAPIPAELMAKIDAAARFNQGYALGETLVAAMLDMRWHTLGTSAIPADVVEFEAEALAQTGLHVEDVPPRYRSSYFRHIFASSGYSAGYYAYLWTEMLYRDAAEWFDANGGMTRANGENYRDIILSRGRTLDYGSAFRALTGHDPQVGPMLRARGLIGDDAEPSHPDETN